MKQRNKAAATSEGKRQAEPELFFPTLMAWFIPGAGHWLLGMRRRAVFYFVSVVGLFLLGSVLGKFTVVSFRYHPYSFLLHVCTGAVAILMTLITNFMQNTPNPTRWGDIGLTMTWISAALNVLLIADVLDRANGGPYEEEQARPGMFKRILQRISGKSE